jgi:hypothetical protein
MPNIVGVNIVLWPIILAFITCIAIPQPCGYSGTAGFGINLALRLGRYRGKVR